MNSGRLIGIVLCVLFIQEGQSTDCDGCSEYLISGPRGISDDNITASSSFPNGKGRLHDPKFSRLHFYLSGNPNAGAWSAGANDDQQYIQAKLSKVKYVKSIVTQGRANTNEWVKTYSVSYSTDGLVWSTIKDVKQNTIIYPANNDRSTIVTNTLPDCLEAKFIILHPKTWYTHVSLRFDLIGCSELQTKASKNKMTWRRHPIIFRPEQSLTQIFKTPTRNINACAMKCKQNALCLSFAITENSGTCIGYQEQIYQGDMTSFSDLSDYVYFISLPQQSHFYVDGSYRNGIWKYATGWDISTTLWSPSHPLSDNGGCVTLTLEGLKTHSCMDSVYFICGM